MTDPLTDQGPTRLVGFSAAGRRPARPSDGPALLEHRSFDWLDETLDPAGAE